MGLGPDLGHKEAEVQVQGHNAGGCQSLAGRGRGIAAEDRQEGLTSSALGVSGSAEFGGNFVIPGAKFGCECCCSWRPRSFFTSVSNAGGVPLLQEEATGTTGLQRAHPDHSVTCLIANSGTASARLITAVSIIYGFLANFRADKRYIPP